MIYRSRVHISADELKYIEDAIENGGMGEDETITNTAKFSNGYEMDIKCCGADDEPAWTEAVLFDSEGSQIAVSEPSDDYFGIWELEDNDGNTYKANVVKVIKRSVDEAKKVLESAGYLVERTPLEARTRDRFNVPKLSKVKDKIKSRITEGINLEHDSYFEFGTDTYDFDSTYEWFENNFSKIACNGGEEDDDSFSINIITEGFLEINDIKKIFNKFPELLWTRINI